MREIVLPGEWKVTLVRRRLFGKLRVRWYFEAEVPKTGPEGMTLSPPPVLFLYKSGDEIWLTNLHKAG